MGLSYVVKCYAEDSIIVIAEDFAERFDCYIDRNHCGRSPVVPTITLSSRYFDIDLTKADTFDQKISCEEYDVEINTCLRFLISSGFSTISKGGQLLAEI